MHDGTQLEHMEQLSQLCVTACDCVKMAKCSPKLIQEVSKLKSNLQ